MRDDEDDWGRWPALADPLRVCAAIIEPAFRKADVAALRHQWLHRELARWASVFGAAAIGFAILQLAFADLIGTREMARAEVVAALLAVVAVVMGLSAALQVRWLVERNKAERLRMAKFRYLINPELWSGNAEADTSIRAALVAEMAAIESLQASDVRHWIEHDPAPQPPATVLQVSAQPPALSELLEYYRTRRLRYQQGVFEKCSKENVPLGRFTKLFSLVLFFGSIGAALIHFGYDLCVEIDRLDLVSRYLIVLAASLPVLGGAIRTWRSTFQFARNTDRYRAKAVALASIDVALDHALEARSVFLGLWLTEQTLENEHREWLRLMFEADWFA
jgi:hypothetical protein